MLFSIATNLSVPSAVYFMFLAFLDKLISGFKSDKAFDNQWFDLEP